jgi:arabinose-5-phosphate isomerase
VRQLMHSGPAMPLVLPSASMPQIIHEMSAKRLGMTTVQASGKLLGVLSDGDLRRLLERNGPHAFHKNAASIMNAKPRAIAPEALAIDALAIMEQHKITALVVTEDGTAATTVLGVLHLHDLWEVAPPAEVAEGETVEAAEPEAQAGEAAAEESAAAGESSAGESA